MHWPKGHQDAFSTMDVRPELVSFRLIARISRTISSFLPLFLCLSPSVYPSRSFTAGQSQDNIRQIALAQVDKEINVWLVRNDVRINQGFVCGLFPQYLPQTPTPTGTATATLPPCVSSTFTLVLKATTTLCYFVAIDLFRFLFSLARPRGIYVIFFNWIKPWHNAAAPRKCLKCLLLRLKTYANCVCSTQLQLIEAGISVSSICRRTRRELFFSSYSKRVSRALNCIFGSRFRPKVVQILSSSARTWKGVFSFFFLSLFGFIMPTYDFAAKLARHRRVAIVQ